MHENTDQWTDEQGAQAIIALQKMVGIDEPMDRAMANWKGFSESERLSTKEAYRLFCCN